MDKSQQARRNKPPTKKGVKQQKSNPAKSNQTQSRDEAELDEAFKFNPDDITLKWPIMHKIELREQCELLHEFRLKFQEQNVKLNDPKKIFFHLFKPNLNLK